MKQTLFDYCKNNNKQYLLDEWNYEKNNFIDLFINEVSYSSGTKAHWICSKGHEWVTEIRHRTRRNSNCPYCSNKRILIGYNDLQSRRPDLIKEWDFNKNNISPQNVSVGSQKSVYWVCPKGHSYKKTVYQRTNSIGCPICLKAKSTSFPEQAIYYYVKKIFPDVISRYKDIFEDTMEIDVYIPSKKVAIEYDGANWHKTELDHQREIKKYNICKNHKIALFRLKEKHSDIWNDTADMVFVLNANDRNSLNNGIKNIFNIIGEENKNLDINCERDKNEIYSYLFDIENSVAKLYPNLVQEWNYQKNGKLKPEMFSAFSGEKVWWKCSKCGNEWQSIIASRAKGHSCNICADSKRKITKKETLLSKREVLNNEKCLLDWDYELNEHKPNYYTKGSGEKVNWKCHVCGYKWQAVICDRTRDYRNGCPLCSNKTIVNGVNDLFTRRPDLKEEWDFEKNNNIDYTKQGIGSHSYAYWKCKKCGYSWQARIDNRTHGKGCPCCANRIVVSGINDLVTTNPELAKEWHPTLNKGLTPLQVTKGQKLKIWWKCSVCGNEWQDTLNHRSSHERGCSVCKHNKKDQTNKV